MLVNIIVQRYFNDSTCILHYYDNLTDPVHLESIPTIKREIWGERNLLFDDDRKCRHFLLQCVEAKYTFEMTEYLIKKKNEGMYNNRKYMIIIEDIEELEDFFESIYLTFIRDVLVIYAPNYNIEDDNKTVDIFMFGDDNYQGNANETITKYYLFTHNYVGWYEYDHPIWLNTWHFGNKSFQLENNLYPDKVTNQYGRELRVICSSLIPYASCESGT